MATDYETPEEAGLAPDERVQFWLDELQLAGKREKPWRKKAGEVSQIYEAAKKTQNSFNILYSNTETVLPALYNATPRPVVRRRFKNQGTADLLAARVGANILEYHLDTGGREYSEMDEAFQAAVVSAEVPGRGVLWYSLGEHCVHPEIVPWDQFRHAYARQWKDVWWTARCHDMTRDELKDNFSEIGEKIPVTAAQEDGEEGKTHSFSSEDNRGSIKVARVWEIWDRRTQTQLWVAEGWPYGFARENDDPYELNGFYPHTKPLMFPEKVSGLKPVAPYQFYEEQAEELNNITQRINKIIAVMKVRGAYDSTVEELGKVFDLSDGELTPVEGLAALSGGTGQPALDKALWIVPIERLVAVLQQLYAQRDQIKQVIYEITGLADILRGASKASETLGAQQIKERWGGLRIKRKQKLVQLYVRDNLRLVLELAVSHLPQKVLVQMAGIDAISAEEKQQVQQIAAMVQQAGQQLPPELGAKLQSPVWEELFGVLRDDLTRSFRVDIETNSTVDVEATEDKQLISEFLVAVGQFLNGVGPLVQQGVLPFEAAQSMLLAVSRRFRFGEEIEDHLMKMQAPQPQDDGKAKELEFKAKESQQALAAKQQEHTQSLAFEQEKHALDMRLEREKIALEREKLQMDRGSKAIEHLLAGAQLDSAEEDRQAERVFQQGEREAGERSAVDREARTAAAKGQAEGQSAVQAVLPMLEQQAEALAGFMQMLQDRMEAFAESLTEVREEVAKPRKRTIQRDASGKALSVDGMPLQRDASGKIISLG